MLRNLRIEHAAHGSEKQGIVHMVGPETEELNQENSLSVGIAIRRQPTGLSSYRLWNWDQ